MITNLVPSFIFTISKKLKIIESVIGIMILILLILRIESFRIFDFLMIISLTSLSILYFLQSFLIIADKTDDKIDNFIYKLSFMNLSINVVGILFRLEDWPGYETYIFSSSTLEILIIATIFYFQSKRPISKIIDTRLKIRIVLLAAIDSLLLFTPEKDLKKLGIINDSKIEIEY